MSKTSWRNDNRAAWRGWQPGHDGEQIAASASAVNVQTTIVYTVAASSVLLLFAWVIDCAGAITDSSSLLVRNVADVTQYTIWNAYFVAAGRLHGAQGLTIPIEVPAGYDIVIANTIAASYTYCFVHGILIPTATV
jgi:hypothetical protein